MRHRISCMQLGAWQLDAVSGGSFWLDGGAMFGVVPKPMWQRVAPPDEANRIPMATNCLLARDGRHTVLVDTGYGGKEPPRRRELFNLEAGEPLVAHLAALGVSPEQIDLVVFSHLHFDHAGGATRLDEQGRLAIVFPRARFVAQQGEWLDAVSGLPELRGSYPLENLLPLQDSGRLELIDGDVEIVPGLRSRVTGGHTRRHQSLVFDSAGQTACFVGDLCPTTAHLRSLWCMAYDVYPLETRRCKPQFLGQAADEGWHLFWDHDPRIVSCRIERHAEREFVIAPNSTIDSPARSSKAIE